MKIKLILIRHGQSEANVNYDVMETVDDPKIPLTHNGLLQAAEAGLKLRERLKDVDDDSITFLYSPWLRAKQTWRMIEAVLNSHRDTGLVCGFQNKNITEHFMNLVGNAENWAKFQTRKALGWSVKGQEDVTYEGGETLRQVHERAKSFVDEVRYGVYCTEYVVAVTHGQFIKAVLAYANKTDVEQTHHPKNCEIIELEFDQE